MPFTLRLDRVHSLELQLRAGLELLDPWPVRPGGTEWEAEFRESLRHPLGFPSLWDTFVGGDRIALAVDPELPSADQILGIWLEELDRAALDVALIEIVTAEQQGNSLRDLLEHRVPLSLRERLEWIAHDPADEAQLAYLAATREGRPLYLNRALCEADVVIPFGLARNPHALSHGGVAAAWFPAFGNLEARDRFAAAGNVQWETHQRRRCEEAHEAAWLLGLNFAVQALPAAGGELAGVVCGESGNVEQATNAFMSQHWTHSFAGQAAATLLVIDGPPAQQSWRNVAQSLHMAARVTADGGAIILATELATDPGPALGSLDSPGISHEEQELAVLRTRSGDAWAARVLQEVFQTHRVFLRSRLDDTTVEDLGLGAWHTAEQLERLLGESDSCLIVRSAQHAVVQQEQVRPERAGRDHVQPEHVRREGRER